MEIFSCYTRISNQKLILGSKFDKLVKSPNTVMPDLIRHPESTVITGFRLSPE